MSDPNVYPSVFVVDGKVNPVSFPPDRRRAHKVNTHLLVLYVLVILAFSGLAIEGYYLFTYRTKEDSDPAGNSAQQQTGGGSHHILFQSLASSLHISKCQLSPFFVTNGSVFFAFFLGEQKDVDGKGKASAHLTGCNCSSPGTAGPLKWESKLGEAFTHEVDYTDNGSLLIKHEGFYYIYSKVFYGEIACKQKPTYFSHAIYKKMPSYKKEIELMLMKKFYCIDSSGQWLANSYLGGVFHLQPDEEIYVKVDNKELVRLGTAENFFGVFQV
ncbi:tumor necrosis factor ligand superfamily member 14 [Erpetoichthys calabaricus]|uniref:tumor necrosis factor ligand superfamily member 14 n=1 Tax=Erpetoichthys calabaricus TaxID=27687 RepID=UPI002234D26F|nr:tumor necrosis factor ligand superfamily member 14 [Erpetoichthys calabaricus]